MSWLRRHSVWLGGLLGVGVIVVVLGISQLNRYLDAPLALPDGGMSFEILPGTPFVAVSRELANLNVLAYPRVLNGYVRWSGKAQQVRAGEYRIEAGSTVASLLDKFVSGDVKMHAFTIVEGWTYRDFIAALATHDAIKITLVFEDWRPIIETLSDRYEHPEGLFLPETYHFPRGTEDVVILRQAFGAMQTAIDDEWANRDENTPLKTPYEALILASIIEKETALAEERPRISGVFVRRLQRRMRLQTDPTVIYGIGDDFDGNLTRKHMRADTAYNTYTRHGLPPTPIALPGRAAIYAALHPQAGNEVFFVATGLGDGSHHFSATKAEHDKAVQEYLSRQRAARSQD